MKKFINPAHTGGLPVYADDVIGMIQSNSFELAKSTMIGLSANLSQSAEPIIVSGVTVTAFGGGTISLSAGLIYFNGEFYNFAGATSVFTSDFLNVTTIANTTRVFKNGTTNDAIETKTYSANTSSGTGDIAITDAATIDTYRLGYGSWYTLSLNTTDWTGSLLDPEFRIEGRYVALRGSLQAQNASNKSGTRIGTLPPGYRPSNNMNIACLIDNTTSNVIGTAMLEISAASGIITIFETTGGSLLTSIDNGNVLVNVRFHIN